MEHLLDVAEFEDGSALVLRDLGSGVEPFATHYRSKDGTEYFWGHYFRREVDARYDFADRVVKQTRRVDRKEN
jgi:hypothetical protein